MEVREQSVEALGREVHGSEGQLRRRTSKAGDKTNPKKGHILNPTCGLLV